MIGNKSKEELLKENFGYIKGIIKKLNSEENFRLSEEDMEDILQQICLKLYETGFDNFRGQCKVTTYIYKIVRNEMLTYVSKKNRTVVSIDICQQVEQYNSSIINNFIDYADQLVNNEVAEIIKNAVNAMPDLQQLIFKLYFIDGLKQEDVAKMYKRSQATIAEHIANIRKSIKQEVEKKFKGFIKELQ